LIAQKRLDEMLKGGVTGRDKRLTVTSGDDGKTFPLGWSGVLENLGFRT